MRVFWTPEAEQDRDDVWTHIASDSLAAAAQLDELFSGAAARLAEFPLHGRPGTVPGTRELVPHESYRLVYEVDVDEDAVWILALVHTARMWPPTRA